jgi:hypothetical protein
MRFFFPIIRRAGCGIFNRDATTGNARFHASPFQTDAQIKRATNISFTHAKKTNKRKLSPLPLISHIFPTNKLERIESEL